MSTSLVDIQHLSFEGGGGKGLVYLGAIKALEEKYMSLYGLGSIRPLIDLSQPVNSRNIRGVSGTSAGAITAFMLALGLTSKQIKEELDKTKKIIVGYSLSGFTKKEIEVSQFDLFYEEFEDDSFYNLRVSNGREKTHANVVFIRSYLKSLIADFFSSKEGVLVSRLASLSDNILVRQLFSVPISANLTEKSKYIGAIDKQLNYLHSLLFCRGIFPGFSIREYFAKILVNYIPSVKDVNSARKITFREFFNLTGVDLVTVGTNLTKGKAEYFSVFHTPDFSVVDAVSISMNLPILFRPLFIDRDVSYGDEELYNSRYKNSFWVDGGMVNNYPINAFNRKTGILLKYQGQEDYYSVASELINTEDHFSFKGDTLGFRLVDKSKTNDSVWWENLRDEIKEKLLIARNLSPLARALSSFYGLEEQQMARKIDDLFRQIFEGEFASLNFGATGGILGGIFKTFMHPGSDGIVDTDLERDRTVELDTTGLSVLDFSSPKTKNDPSGDDVLSKLKLNKIEEAFEETLKNVY